MKDSNEEQKKVSLLSLFLTMIKIGAFTFGGGYAMIALLENEFVEKKSWIDTDDFTDMVAIAESTPGPIAINAATYIGYKNCGVPGSLVSTLAICIPSFTIIFLISLFFNQFMTLTYVARAFRGIQVCVTFLILMAGIKMFIKMKKNAFNIIILAITFVCVITFSLLDIGFSTIYYILISGILGLMVYLIGYLKDRKKPAKPSDKEGHQ